MSEERRVLRIGVPGEECDLVVGHLITGFGCDAVEFSPRALAKCTVIPRYREWLADYVMTRLRR